MKNILVNLLILVTTTFLVFVLLEGLTRMYVWSKASFSFEKELIRLIEKENISEDTFNIYYLGGSTMKGFGYGAHMTIPRIVDTMHDHKIQRKEIRSVNIAKGGANLQDNLERLRLIVSSKDMYHPSLVVIYSGHNEFLRFHQSFGFQRRSGFLEWLIRHSVLMNIVAARLQLYRVEIDERQFSDNPLFDKTKYEAVIQEYRKGLEETVDLLNDSGIPVIISTVVGNYADWQPNRSVFCSKNIDKHHEDLIQRGQRAEEKLQFKEAIDLYQQALVLCKSFAETHYRLGKTYEALKKYDKALEEYNKAIDYDGMPLRALSVQNDFIRSLDGHNSVFIIDAVKTLQEQTPNGLIGFNLMLDAHHPNQKGYLIIGKLIAQKIKDLFAPDLKNVHTIDIDEARELFDIDDENLFNIYIKSGRWFSRISTWRHDPIERLNLSEEFFSKAMELDQSRYEPYLGLAMVNFLRKDYSKAQLYLSKAKNIDERQVNEYLKAYWVRAIVNYAKAN